MEIKNEHYFTYIKYPISDIPDQYFTGIMNELATNAIFLMGNEFKDVELKKTLQAVTYVIKTYYGFIPLHLVAEAFGKGSIGNLGGTSKFNARNVNTWMQQVQDKYQTLTVQQKSREDNNRRAEAEKIFKQNQAHNVRFGTALSIKLTWVYQRRISVDDWERYTLDAIVEELKHGKTEKTLIPSDIWRG